MKKGAQDPGAKTQFPFNYCGDEGAGDGIMSPQDQGNMISDLSAGANDLGQQVLNIDNMTENHENQ